MLANHAHCLIETGNVVVGIPSLLAIGDGYDSDSNMNSFKKMYGNDGEFVDVTSVMSVSKTMNKKFLEKN